MLTFCLPLLLQDFDVENLRELATNSPIEYPLSYCRCNINTIANIQELIYAAACDHNKKSSFALLYHSGMLITELCIFCNAYA